MPNNDDDDDVPQQPLEPYWISRSWVKGQGHVGFLCVFFVCM